MNFLRTWFDRFIPNISNVRNHCWVNDRPTEAQTDLQSAIVLAGSKSIVLAQVKQAEDPMVSDRPEVIDRQNNFNLALYYLAAGRFEESDGLSRSGRLCQRASEAFRDSMVSDRPKVIEMAIRDLDDYLTLFPDQARAILGELRRATVRVTINPLFPRHHHDYRHQTESDCRSQRQNRNRNLGTAGRGNR